MPDLDRDCVSSVQGEVTYIATQTDDVNRLYVAFAEDSRFSGT